MAVLGAAVFFGFMLALLQRRVSAMFSSQTVSLRKLLAITITEFEIEDH